MLMKGTLNKFPKIIISVPEGHDHDQYGNCGLNVSVGAYVLLAGIGTTIATTSPADDAGRYAAH
jgi:hypothetical protein